MSPHPVCVGEDATIEEVVKQMDIYQISQVLILRQKACRNSRPYAAPSRT
ncbi:hypothetical protein [Bradyrhizobium japonicum]